MCSASHFKVFLLRPTRSPLKKKVRWRDNLTIYSFIWNISLLSLPMQHCLRWLTAISKAIKSKYICKSIILHLKVTVGSSLPGFLASMLEMLHIQPKGHFYTNGATILYGNLKSDWICSPKLLAQEVNSSNVMWILIPLFMKAALYSDQVPTLHEV